MTSLAWTEKNGVHNAEGIGGFTYRWNSEKQTKLGTLALLSGGGLVIFQRYCLYIEEGKFWAQSHHDALVALQESARKEGYEQGADDMDKKAARLFDSVADQAYRNAEQDISIARDGKMFPQRKAIGPPSQRYS